MIMKRDKIVPYNLYMSPNVLDALCDTEHGTKHPSEQTNIYTLHCVKEFSNMNYMDSVCWHLNITPKIPTRVLSMNMDRL